MSAKKNQITLFLTLRGNRDVNRKLREASSNIERFGRRSRGAVGLLAGTFVKSLPVVTKFGESVFKTGLFLKRNIGYLLGYAAALPTVSAGLGRLGFHFASLAADAKEIRSLFLQAFPGEATVAMDQAIQRLVRNLGLSKSELEKHAALMAVFGSKAGLGGQDLAKFADQLLWVGADLTASYNTSFEDAMAAIKSGLSGETEPLKQFGIIMTEADLAAQSAALGFDKAYKSMSAGEKVMVRAAFIQKNLGFATGQAMREADSFGTVMRALKASAKGWGEQLGGPLIDPFKRAAIVLMDVGDRIIPKVVERLTELFGQTNEVETAFNEFMRTVERVGMAFLDEGWRGAVEELFGPDAVYMIEDLIASLKAARRIIKSVVGGIGDAFIPAGGEITAVLSPLRQFRTVLEQIAGYEGGIRALAEVLATLSVPAAVLTVGKKGADGIAGMVAEGRKLAESKSAEPSPMRKRMAETRTYVDGWLMHKQFHWEQNRTKKRRAKEMKRDSWLQNNEVLKKEYKNKPGYWKARRERLHELDVMYGIGAGRRRTIRRAGTRTKMVKGKVTSFFPKILDGMKAIRHDPSIITTKLSKGLKAISQFARANPLGLIVTAIAAVVTAFIGMYRNSDKLRATLDGLWQGIQTVAGVVMGALSSALSGFWQNVGVPFMDWWQTKGFSILGETARIAGDILADVLNGIGSVLTWLWDTIAKPVFTWFAENAWPKVQEAFEMAGPIITGVLDTLGAGLTALNQGIETAWNAFKGFIDWVKEHVLWVFEKLSNLMGSSSGGNASMVRVHQSGGAATSSPVRTPGSMPYGHIPHNAWGGQVKGLHPYIVGERGRELFVPESSGVIVPDHVLRSPTLVGGSKQVHVAVTFGDVHVGGRLSPGEGDAVARELADRITREVVRKVRVAQAVG